MASKVPTRRLSPRWIPSLPPKAQSWLCTGQQTPPRVLPTMLLSPTPGADTQGRARFSMGWGHWLGTGCRPRAGGQPRTARGSRPASLPQGCSPCPPPRSPSCTPPILSLGPGPSAPREMFRVPPPREARARKAGLQHWPERLLVGRSTVNCHLVPHAVACHFKFNQTPGNMAALRHVCVTTSLSSPSVSTAQPPECEAISVRLLSSHRLCVPTGTLPSLPCGVGQQAQLSGCTARPPRPFTSF